MDAWTGHKTGWEEVCRGREAWLEMHAGRLLASYRHWTGEALWVESARALFEAPFPILSGGIDAEQTLNYGNAAALRLWETDWETFTRMPARLTAEPVHRSAREAFLQRVREEGVIRDYTGVRISARGRRFRIEQATVWNVVDAAGVYHGQAATFARWTMLEGNFDGSGQDAEEGERE
jgi:hypothetical protein